MVGLGGTGSPPFQSDALGISGDGSTIVGTNSISGAFSGAIRWTAAYGFQELPVVASSAIAASDDGTVIIGQGTPSSFRWTSFEGPVYLYGLNGSPYSTATGVSADGLTIVGTANVLPPPGEDSPYQAFRWTPASLMVGLGVSVWRSHADEQRLCRVSGWASGRRRLIFSATGMQAFRWTQQGGMQGLGFISGATLSQALGVSANGSVVVGTVSATGDWATHAFV